MNRSVFSILWYLPFVFGLFLLTPEEVIKTEQISAAPQTQLMCPTNVIPIFTNETICSGDTPNVPPDAVILDNVDDPTNAIVIWNPSPSQPIFNNNICDLITIDFNYFIGCTQEPTLMLPGGTHTVEVYPQPQPPAIQVDMDCNYFIVPACPSDDVNPPFVDPGLPNQTFTVTNAGGCTQTYDVPTPSCFPPITTQPEIIITICDQYVVEFIIEGGTGNYVVNGMPIFGDVFTSTPIPCGQDYSFFITDDMGTSDTNVSGTGPLCPTPLVFAENITIVANDYFVTLTISGGTGNYTVNGDPIPGNTYTSALIPCGQPYTFVIDDGCSSIDVNGEPVICYDPITTTPEIVTQNCDTYAVEFTIMGGTGNYVVDGMPIPGDVFTSTPISCGQDYTFNVTDDIGTSNTIVSGTGIVCLPPLAFTENITIAGSEFFVTLIISGGTDSYTVDGNLIPGNTFTSDLIPCGQNYSFLIDDGCSSIDVNGGPVICYAPITTTPAIIIQGCDTYIIQFIIMGGTGNYLVNGIPISGDVFTSTPIPCGQDYDFSVTDDLGTSNGTVSGTGTVCYTPLVFTENITVVGLEFFVTLIISGGTDDYTVNGNPIPGNTFNSALIPCGQPYSFLIDDGCSSIDVNGGPVICYTPITTTLLSIEENCNTYQVIFGIDGGTGNYFVDGIPVLGNTYFSDPLPCGLPYSFFVTDDLTSDVTIASGGGTTCLPEFEIANPVIEITGNQYQVTIDISGGTGNYFVNGDQLNSNVFTSDPIDCGQPYNFLISDTCTDVPLSGDSPDCFSPVESTLPETGLLCNQYTASFTLSGGTGNYSVDGMPIPGDLYISEPLPCGTPFSFEATDDALTNTIIIDGNGEDCLDDLSLSDPIIDINDNSYTVTIIIDGGTGGYTANGVNVNGNVFTSDPIGCGQPYNFLISDTCTDVPLSGDSPNCFGPVESTLPETGLLCNQYTASFTLSGGTGNYSVDGMPIPGDLYISEPLPCGTPFSFEATDDALTNTIIIDGNGEDCLDDLSLSDPIIDINDNSYSVTIIIDGGTGDYTANGVSINGNVFTSDPIDCGQPYNFLISDTCTDVPLSGDSPNCFGPVESTLPETGLLCNQYTASFTLSGGTGNYSVDGMPIPGDLYISELLPCGTPFSFEATDDALTNTIIIDGNGEDCLDDLSLSDPIIDINDNSYSVTIIIDGGTGDYTANGVNVNGNVFTSDPIDCGQPYNFLISDTCTDVPLSGDSPDCFSPVESTLPETGLLCNQYTASFTLSGGTGNYSVDGMPIPGDLYISEPLPCGTPFSFEATDDALTNTIIIDGNGEDCLDDLSLSDPIIDINDNSYSVTIIIDGGTGDYTANGVSINGNVFTSDPIGCGQPYNFLISDTCTDVPLSGDSPDCFGPVESTLPETGLLCNQYTASFTLSGGTGNYSVDGMPIPGDLYISEPLPCGTPFSFEATDDALTNTIIIDGNGEDCLDDLSLSNPIIDINDNSYSVTIIIDGGTGDYTANGVNVNGNVFTSDPIDCGQPYNFLISDTCTDVPLSGDSPDCPNPITTSAPETGADCNQYTASFTISGGTGNYLVDGLPITGDFYISELLDCETAFNFEVTDDQMTETLEVTGEGTECLDPLVVPEIAFTINADQYTVEFDISGGTGAYTVNGNPVDGNQFTSEAIACGMPFSFTVADGCEEMIVAGEAPCEACPSVVGDFSNDLVHCNGDVPALPTDDEILASIDLSNQAIIVWSAEPNQSMIYSGNGCDPQTLTYDLTIQCATDDTNTLSGGTVVVSLYPDPSPPEIILVATTDTSCMYEIIPNCLHDLVEPNTIMDLPDGTSGTSAMLTVSNLGCAGVLYEVPIPDCIIDDIDNIEKKEKSDQLSVYPNPLDQTEMLTIQLDLSTNTPVRLSVFDVNGHLLKVIEKELLMKGTHFLNWDGTSTSSDVLAAGVYFIEMQTQNGRTIEKIIRF